MPSMSPDQLHSRVTAFLASARDKAAGGLTVAEFGGLVVELLRLAVSGLDAVATLDGPAKRAWALSCVATLFDAVADSCVPLLARPVWWIVRPTVRALVLAAAGGALEQVLGLVRAVGRSPETLAP